MLRAFGRITDVLIASFDDDTIADIKAREPEIHTTPGLNGVFDFVVNPQPIPEHVALQIPRDFQGVNVPEFAITVAPIVKSPPPKSCGRVKLLGPIETFAVVPLKLF